MSFHLICESKFSDKYLLIPSQHSTMCCSLVCDSVTLIGCSAILCPLSGMFLPLPSGCLDSESTGNTADASRMLFSMNSCEEMTNKIMQIKEQKLMSQLQCKDACSADFGGLFTFGDARWPPGHPPSLYIVLLKEKAYSMIDGLEWQGSLFLPQKPHLIHLSDK